MPDYFCHSVLAQVMWERSPKNLRSTLDRNLYLLGAQGGDMLFAYRADPTKKNAGKQLHDMPPSLLFHQLQGGNNSLICGFLTHYVVDSRLHPYVYEWENTSKISVWAHRKFEEDLGLFCSRTYGIPRTILPKQTVLCATFALYDTLKRALPFVTLTGIERSLKRYFAYSVWVCTHKKTTFVCHYPYSELKPVIEDVIDEGVQLICEQCQGNLDEEKLTLPFLNGKKK